MKSPLRLLVLFAFLILLGDAAEATQVRYKSVEQMGSQSVAVVRGKVASVESSWNDKRTKIFTETTIAVDESYKGPGGGVVRILQLGGEVDGVRVTVHGALAWRPGEEVVVFLDPYVSGTYHVSGFCQGKFDVERDPETGEAFIRRPAITDVQLVDALDQDTQAQRGARIERVPIDRFINQALGRRQGGEKR
jgi:hypothetical protein